MNEQQSENNQAMPAAPRYIRLMIRGEVLRFDFDTDERRDCSGIPG